MTSKRENEITYLGLFSGGPADFCWYEIVHLREVVSPEPWQGGGGGKGGVGLKLKIGICSLKT